MKKLVLMFVAVAAISFASCGNNTAKTEEAEEAQEDTTIVADSTETEEATEEEATEAAPEEETTEAAPEETEEQGEE